MNQYCPVCMNLITSDKGICSNCGYSESTNYEHYLSLGPIQKNAIPAKELLRREWSKYVSKAEMEKLQKENARLLEQITKLQSENLSLRNQLDQALKENESVTREKAQELRSPSLRRQNFQAGQIIQRGTYNGKPISWRVLAVDEEKAQALVISEQAIDHIFFHNSKEQVSWKNSALRIWLTERFYELVFDEEEKMQIAGRMRNRISLPSLEEVRTYFTSDEERKCLAFDAGKKATSKNQYVDWWIKDYSVDPFQISAVSSDGSIQLHAFNADNITVYVRPTMNLKLEY